MSNPTVEQMNEAIALFDGWELISGDPTHICLSCDKGVQPSGWCTCDAKADRFSRPGRIVGHTYFQYHSSWDCLMPVGKRIRDLLSDMLSKRPPHTACMGDVIEVDITCALHEYDITKVHEAIYGFIQWYNKAKEVNNER
jgi:hypothetical protein